MQHHEKVKKLVGWFAKAASRHAEAMEAMAEEVAAAEVADLDRFYRALQREGGMAELLLLLEDPDPVVAGMVAVYAMPEAPEPCVARLTLIAGEPGLIGFRAQAALERWERGEWEK
ncbi:hypothetical protein KP001_10220 [Geomonas subterranea]|uniref:DUF2019 domain-containing protein n=1 Tax=Geomonas subterranea TaxID=2847989 RepID=A0ABX8LRH2_9BACT|nr:hypothetical protein [Geomonas subterranea]QXE92858.1 hypothetical protein KP001_10220 [Geomonas subterranea]QXM09037.1 hypothetical protein KP002_19055 [Geomonas subterranea]